MENEFKGVISHELEMIKKSLNCKYKIFEKKLKNA
jgi:hypothetical protein